MTVFPGSAAIVPVAGAMLVIAAGRTHGPGSITWLVDRRVVQWLGNISYSLYLWHWPLVVWWHALRPGPAVWEGPIVVAVALVVAATSYRVIEQRFRRPVGRRRWPTLAVAVTSSLAVAAVGFLPAAAVVYQTRQREALAAEPPSGRTAISRGRRRRTSSRLTLSPPASNHGSRVSASSVPPIRAILNRIRERGDVNVVLTTAFIVPYVADDSGQQPGVAGFIDFWQRLDKAGIEGSPSLTPPAGPPSRRSAWQCTSMIQPRARGP